MSDDAAALDVAGRIAREAAELVREIGQVAFRWVPRERNRRADALANQAMDAQAVP